MNLLGSIRRRAMAIDKYAFHICGVCMFVILAIGTIDVVLGNTIGYRPTATVDISSAMFVTSVFLALPYVVRRNDHIRVDLFVNMFPASVRRVTDPIAMAVSTLAYLALAYAMWDLFIRSWTIDEHSVSVFSFPIYPVKLAAFAGLVLAALFSIAQLLRSAKPAEHE